MKRRLLLLGIIMLALLRPDAAQAEPLALDVYRERLGAAYAAAQRSDRIGLDEVAAQLVDVDSITTADGTPLPVNNSWLRDALAQEPPPYPLITARLGALLDAFGQPRTPLPADALQRLDNVFAVPPFKDREVPQGVTSAIGNFFDSIGRAIKTFFDWVFSNPTPAPNPPPQAPPANNQPAQTTPGLSGLGSFFLIISALLVMALVFYALRNVRGSLIRNAKLPKTKVDTGEELSSADAIERAHTERQTGDYRTAVRYLYLASLLWMHEQRLLRYDRSLTNREYVGQLDGKPLQGQLRPIVDTFDRVWYGKETLGDDEFNRYEAEINDLRGKRPPSA